MARRTAALLRPPDKQVLRLHKGLHKEAESSLIVQLRTGKCGLRRFLFSRQVPDVTTPQCSGGSGDETPEACVHVLSQQQGPAGYGRRDSSIVLQFMAGGQKCSIAARDI